MLRVVTLWFPKVWRISYLTLQHQKQGKFKINNHNICHKTIITLA